MLKLFLGCNDVNEVVKSCPDPCPLSCDNLETHDTTPCLQMCKTRGCVCRPGYVRSSNGTCIIKSSCRKALLNIYSHPILRYL